MEPLMVVEGLQKVYPDGTQGLVDASFAIQKGEFVAIMGPSGSGKSTLLHILGFLDVPSGGVYRFRGASFDAHSRAELAAIRNTAIGFVFQQFNLMPRSSVYDNMALPLFYASVPRQAWRGRIETALARVGLSHRRDHQAYMLSGGEKQRVAIARALINEPDVVFADEPTGNLDSQSGDQVMGIIETLHQEGNTVVLITHDSAVATRAHRTLYVYDGIVAEHARPQNELQNDFNSQK
jgi:putative ABC transport system ATP-binding protein